MKTEEFIGAMKEMGADDVRIADTGRLEGLPTQPEDLLRDHPRAVSLCLRLADPPVDTVVDRPTPLYAQHVSRVSAFLDELALRGANLLQRAGHRAMPLPASQTLDHEKCFSYVSHKAVAIAAGLGWQGKSLIVVHPRYGPRIRLNTILTNAPLDTDEPVRNRCGTCSACKDACPAGAIRGVNTEYHYSSRDEALEFHKCRDMVQKRFARLEHINGHICGVCVRVCPWGQQQQRKARASD